MENSSSNANNQEPSSEEVKQSVIDGQLVYKNGETDQFREIDRKDFMEVASKLLLRQTF